MARKKQKLPITKIVIIIMLLSFLLTVFLPLFARVEAKETWSLHEKQKILKDLNKQKSNLASKLKEARLKEAYASDKLRSINRKLRRAENDLTINKKYLASNKAAWQRTKARLDEINSQKVELETEAKKRILSIY